MVARDRVPLPAMADLTTPPAAHLESLLAYVDVAPQLSIVDLGCGDGGDAVYLAKRGWVVTAVDLSRVALLLGRARARAANARVRFARADVTRLTEQGVVGPFDVAYDHACFLNLCAADGARYAVEVAAIVRPGGLLVVLTADPDLPAHAVGRYFCPVSNETFDVFAPWFEHRVSLGAGHCAIPTSWQLLVRTVKAEVADEGQAQPTSGRDLRLGNRAPAVAALPGCASAAISCSTRCARSPSRGWARVPPQLRRSSPCVRW